MTVSPTARQNFVFDEASGRPAAPKPGWATKPVTYVSMQDAREYCAFHKKRLPHNWEVRHCLCLVCSTAFATKTLPLPCVFYCFFG